MKKNNKIIKIIQCLVVIFCMEIFMGEDVFADILWEQNFNNSPVWQSTPSATHDVSSMTTHADAISMWNASSYRVAKQKHDTNGTVILEVSEAADRQGAGKGLTYYFNGVGDWQAASIDLAFNDPDVQWKTTVDPSGYTELWLTLWYRTPEKMIWYDPAQGEEVPVGFELWKGCRFWAYDYKDYIQKYNANHGTNFPLTPEGHWQTLMASGEILSSHYLDHSTFYKKPFYIVSWYGQTLYHDPNWLKEIDPDAGTSGFPHAHNRNDLSTHLLEGKNWFGDGSPITGIFGDLQWHRVEYHVKLNDLGQSNSIEEVYIDGSLTPLITAANNQEMRITNRKFQQVILFDNYLKKYGGKQPMYIDDIVLSTERIEQNYVIGGGNSTTIRADVDNNSTINTTDAMLTLRNSLGLSMNGTNWYSSSTTGDVNCDNVSNSTDAMLILRHSLGLDMNGTGWCE
jgi:hypothetical protein